MTQAQHWNDQQLEAAKAILAAWPNLSAGDISVILACIRQPGIVLTVRGTAHADFWANLVRIGWAEQLYSPVDPYDLEHEPMAFRMLEAAERPLSHFLVHFNLLNMGACTPANDADRGQGEPIQRTDAGRISVAKYAIKGWAVVAGLLAGAVIGRVING